MRNNFSLVLMSAGIIFLSGCALHSVKTDNQAYGDHKGNIDEQVDLYLSTLDDKHFVWCELDLNQCRKDFQKWKLSSRGRTIIREFEKEDTGQTYNRHQVPNVFRTRFVEESQFEDAMEKREIGQDPGGKNKQLGKLFPILGQDDDLQHQGIHLSPQMYGPEAPSNFGDGENH